MSSIKKYRNIIDNAIPQEEHYLVEDTKFLPSPEIFEHDDGMIYVGLYLENNGLDEGIADTLGGLFKGAREAISDLKNGTSDAFNRKMQNYKNKFNHRMSRDMKKQVKAITKKLKDKYYFDLNLTIQSFEKKKGLYSEPFFEELIKSFSLDPDVERQVWKEYKPQMRKLVNGIKGLYKEYRSNNPDAPKPPRVHMAFDYLPKVLKKEVLDDANYLVGSMIGFTAAVSIADYFQKNPATFKECSDTILENVDVNGSIETISVERVMADMTRNNETNILEQLSNLDVDDDGEFDWEDDIEDEHDTIYKQYIEGK